MRKLLLSLFTVVAALSMANAGEVTFDLTKPDLFGFAVPAASSGTDLNDGTLEAGNVVITSKKVAKNDTRFWALNTGTVEGLRGYKTSTLTFSTTNGEIITEIKFEGAAISAKHLTFDNGSYTSPTWIGSEGVVVLTFADTGKISAITVTTASATGVQEPRFSLAEGTYYVAQEVELSCGTVDATIHYTTDNSDPTTSSATYSSPIKIETTTTIKAIAVKGGDKSDIVSATYTIAEPVAVENIAAFKETSKETVVKFANSVDVIYQNGAYLFIQDATGASLIYGTVGKKYENGNTIAQLLPMAETFEPAVPGTVIEPIMIKVQDITEELMNKLVKISDVAIVRDGTTRNYTITDVSGSVNAYSRFTDVSIPEDDKKYDITAIVNKYGGKPQLFPIEVVESEGGVGFADVESASSIVAAGDKAINIDAAENAQVLVVNAGGQVVVNKAITAGANTIDVPAGFYVVRVNNAVTKVIIK